MSNFVQALITETQESNFCLWQNQIAADAKASLKISRSIGEKEVATVTRLCNNLNAKAFNRISLYSKKIHGKASYVSFLDESNTPNVRELSDMVILSLITEEGRILYARMAFVQNKMEDKPKEWNIQQDQLYLLTNFPTFDGVSGIFGGMANVALLDPFGQLGNYGLFCSPCEMVFANADVITAMQSGTSVAFDNIKKNTTEKKYKLSNWGHVLYYLHKYGYKKRALPILGTCSVALNMHQFIRNWTQFNIGEEIVVDGVSCCPHLTNLAKKYMKAAGMDTLADFQIEYSANDNRSVDLNISEIDAAVMVVNLDISHSER